MGNKFITRIGKELRYDWNREKWKIDLENDGRS